MAARATIHVQSQSQNYVTIDSLSASLPWFETPVWGSRPDFWYFQDSYVFFDVVRPL
jgi:hypothetical protein